MENALQKLAKQLNQYDEASLLALWEKYAAQVARFEPSKRWEEAALILAMIQGVHWKNQLFNTEFSQSRARMDNQEAQSLRRDLSMMVPGPSKTGTREKNAGKDEESGAVGRDKGKHGRKVLMFRPRDLGES